MRICPKCGKKYGDGEDRCRAFYGTPPVRCTRALIEFLDWTDEDEANAMQDLEDGIMADPFEDYTGKAKPKSKPKSEPEPDLREDLKGQSDQIHDLLEIYGNLTYDRIAELLDPPVSPTRASRLIGQMIRDGVELKREGTPRKVSLA